MRITYRQRHGEAPPRARKYVLAFVGFAVAGALGVSSAAWWTIPNGSGHAYGHGRAAGVGVALTTVEFTTPTGLLSPDIGPSETGQLTWKAHNPNAFQVTVTSVTIPAGSVISSLDGTCTAPASTFSVAPWGGTGLAVAANSDSGLGDVTLTTGATFPSCMQDKQFSIPVTLTAVAS